MEDPMDRDVITQVSYVVNDVGVESRTVADPPPHEKLLKYFPEAALALYIALEPVLRELISKSSMKVVLWCLLGGVVAFCWAYLSKFWNLNKKHKGTNPHYVRQKFISEVALVAYLAAIGGPFAEQWGEDYNKLWGTFAAIVITAIILFVKAPEAPEPTK
jgi:hypothetical protein